AVGRPREAGRLERARLRIEQLERIDCCARDDTRDAAVAEKGKAPSPEDEGGNADLAVLEPCEGAVVAVQIPPAVAVADEVQTPLRRPGRLDHGLLAAAGDELLAGKRRPITGQLGDPQLGPVPRHARVVPANPREPAAIG